MIRPHHFTPNPHTATDNAFQSHDDRRDSAAIARDAHAEVTIAAERLTQAGVTVHLFEDENTLTPDSCFPNNWFSTHAGGKVAIYPMCSPSRRKERRSDVIDMLKARYRVHEIVDYSGLESDSIYLEGTGSFVLDHVERVAYAARSNRTSEMALERFCTHFSYEPVVFDASDRNGQPIYHTNVLMCIAAGFAMIGLDTIRDSRRRNEVRERLANGGRTVIELTHDQIENFAGNAIELAGTRTVLALSTRADSALRPDQRIAVEKTAEILPLDVPTIELAGGSVRCMLAGVHLSPRVS